jgi:hypothetical protein
MSGGYDADPSDLERERDDLRRRLRQALASAREGWSALRDAANLHNWPTVLEIAERELAALDAEKP